MDCFKGFPDVLDCCNYHRMFRSNFRRMFWAYRHDRSFLFRMFWTLLFRLFWATRHDMMFKASRHNIDDLSSKRFTFHRCSCVRVHLCPCLDVFSFLCSSWFVPSLSFFLGLVFSSGVSCHGFFSVFPGMASFFTSCFLFPSLLQ